MKRLTILLNVMFLLACLSQAQEEKHQEKVIKYLKIHHFATLHRQFDKELADKISINYLRKSYKNLEKAIGKYQSHGKITLVKTKKGNQFITLIYYQRGSLVLSTSFGDNGKITNINLTRKIYTLPEYGENLVYNKEEIIIHSGPYNLPGEIAYPKNLNQKVPLVILVHGSGANDRYESDGTIKVFKDLYLGLLSKGIACMVYDKRTLVYKEEYDSIQYTLWDETINDAISAFKLAKTKVDIDTNKIVMVGHSLGGYALPLILKSCIGVKAGISMAGCARPLEVLLGYQYDFLSKDDGKVTLAEKFFLKKERKKIKFVQSEALLTAKPSLKILANWPSLFLKDLRNYRPVEVMKTLDMPVLFLQGDRDYQVTNDDFKLWKSGYLEKKDWFFISYPKLNHRFVEGEGKPNRYEYMNGGNIPIYVINDMSNWIKDLK